MLTYRHIKWGLISKLLMRALLWHPWIPGTLKLDSILSLFKCASFDESIHMVHFAMLSYLSSSVFSINVLQSTIQILIKKVIRSKKRISPWNCCLYNMCRIPVWVETFENHILFRRMHCQCFELTSPRTEEADNTLGKNQGLFLNDVTFG